MFITYMFQLSYLLYGITYGNAKTVCRKYYKTVILL